MKRCTQCKKKKAEASFYKCKRSKDGRRSCCTTCVSKLVAEWRRLREYNLTQEQYLQLLSAQQNKCAICYREFSRKTHADIPQVDHCHDTKEVRGLLCVQCNQALGQFYDNPATLLRAAAYLGESTARQLFQISLETDIAYIKWLATCGAAEKFLPYINAKHTINTSTTEPAETASDSEGADAPVVSEASLQRPTHDARRPSRARKETTGIPASLHL